MIFDVSGSQEVSYDAVVAFWVSLERPRELRRALRTAFSSNRGRPAECANRYSRTNWDIVPRLRASSGKKRHRRGTASPDLSATTSAGSVRRAMTSQLTLSMIQAPFSRRMWIICSWLRRLELVSNTTLIRQSKWPLPSERQAGSC